MACRLASVPVLTVSVLKRLQDLGVKLCGGYFVVLILLLLLKISPAGRNDKGVHST
jgi:hypothetical protein